jgi:hypothetical protein
VEETEILSKSDLRLQSQDTVVAHRSDSLVGHRRNAFNW